MGINGHILEKSQMTIDIRKLRDKIKPYPGRFGVGNTFISNSQTQTVYMQHVLSIAVCMTGYNNHIQLAYDPTKVGILSAGDPERPTSYGGTYREGKRTKSDDSPRTR